MKLVLLAVAVILAVAAYELNREYELAADRHSRVAVDRLLDALPADRGVPTPDDAHPGNAAARPAPRAAGAQGVPAGTVEQENSIRLFGPGVSRKHQIRV